MKTLPTLLVVSALLGLGSGALRAANPQPAILTTIAASNRAVIFHDPNGAPTVQSLPSLPSNAFTHGVSYYGRDNALIADYSNSRIFVVQISTAALLATIDTAVAGYDGGGTIAVAPSLRAALAMGNSDQLYVVHAPFLANSAITSVKLPGQILGLQTQGIVFNNAGRAFVHTTAGISVLDAPYTRVLFTMPPVRNATNGGAIAISPNGNTLLVTAFGDDEVRIYQAPYSAESVPALLTIPGRVGQDGIAITPDGTKAIVVTSNTNATIRASAISAPFSASSKVEALPLPAGTNAFEDVGISADGQLAILAGNGVALDGTSEAPIFVRAPFTAAGAQAFAVPVANTSSPSRGNGSARFLPPGLAPGLSILAESANSGALGTNFTYTLTYANTGNSNATNVVIRAPVPTGTIFVSATNGGTLVNGSVVFNLGTVPAGAGVNASNVGPANAASGSLMVSFTVKLGSSRGAVVNNNNYTIQADGVPPIAGPPISAGGYRNRRATLSAPEYLDSAECPDRR